jgi:exopolysaccharide production protein ExoQ
LTMANSVTSSVCFAIGTGLMVATSRRFMKRHSAAIHTLVLLLMVTSSVVILFGGAGMFNALGRNATLTGRTEIWRGVIPMVPNPLVGAGFESFWLSPFVHRRLAELLAHDGYIEVYLNLGWVGVSLIGLILIDGYRRSVKGFRREPALGGLLLAYILAAIVYSITEAGFRMLHPMWVFFLLAVIEASDIAVGVGVSTSALLDPSPGWAPQLSARNTLAVRPMARKIERRRTA